LLHFPLHGQFDFISFVKFATTCIQLALSN
jgi:hypothetical protein